MPLILPPVDLWLPSKPAIIRPADPKLLEAAHPIAALFGRGKNAMVVKASAPTIINTSSTSHAVNMPSGGGTGDRYVMLVQANTGVNWTVPSGWTAISSVSGNSVASLEHIYDGTETSTVSLTTSSSVTLSAEIVLVSKTDTTVASQLSSTASSGSASTTATPIAISPSWGTANNSFILIYYGLTGSATVSAFPAGYTSWQADGSDDATSTFEVVGCAGVFNATTITPGGFTFSGSVNYAGRTIAIKGLV